MSMQTLPMHGLPLHGLPMQGEVEELRASVEQPVYTVDVPGC